MKEILLVCTGNICRSSMAEGLLKAMVEADPLLSQYYTVSSAGTSAWDGDRASDHSVNVLKDKYGIDIRGHRARMLDSQMAENAFLILTMTRSHKDWIVSRFPEARQKVFTLKEYAYGRSVDKAGGTAGDTDIGDPFGMPYKYYESCAKDISEALLKLLEKLKNGEISR